MERMSLAQFRSMNQNKAKYGNTKFMGFDSIKEWVRYNELLLLEKYGLIENLRRQVKYTLQDKMPGIREISYVADFVYLESGKVVVEDVKGYRTQVYLLKKKMFMARYPEINFREV